MTRVQTFHGSLFAENDLVGICRKRGFEWNRNLGICCYSTRDDFQKARVADGDKKAARCRIENTKL